MNKIILGLIACATLQTASANSGIYDGPAYPESFQRLHPDQQISQENALLSAKLKYIEILAHGGWKYLDFNTSLSEGMSGDHVEQLNSRLKAEGFLPNHDNTDNRLFSEMTREALIAFQRSRGIADDGVAGKETLRELNVPVEQRIQQIDKSIEQYEAIINDRSELSIVINIPEYRLRVYNEGRETLSIPVIVGKPSTRTPLMTTHMTHIVFNPPWNAPSGIASKEILPNIKRDPSYLSRHNMVISDANGIVNEHHVDWNSIGERMPFKVTQLPGKSNALGAIKFHLDSDTSIYIHGTNAEHLLDETYRARSHGCIRTKSPQNLAGIILAHTNADYVDIDSMLSTKTTKWVKLDNPVPVKIIYATAWASKDGKVGFYRDVYGREKQYTALRD